MSFTESIHKRGKSLKNQSKNIDNIKEEIHIRDFIYLDIDRIKSILAQLEKGLTENRIETRSKVKEISGEGNFSINAIIKAAGGAKYLWENQTSQTKTLHDHIYNYIEHKLIAGKQLIKINERFTEKDWENGKIYKELKHTSYILSEGYFLINDYNYMAKIFNSFNDLGEFFAYCSTLNNSRNNFSKQAIQQFKEKKKSMQLEDKLIDGFKLFFDVFYKDRLVIKVLPYEDFSNFRFVGILQEAYLRDNIQSIIYKYGTNPVSKWNLFAQIASLTEKDHKSFNPTGMVGSSVEIAMQGVFSALQGFEAAGLSASYPEIAVTPIVIYRE
jgi:hypothetical protein